MKKIKINNFLFYKYRYVIGYSVISVSYLALILYSLFIAPNGLTSAEISSSTDSFNFSLSNLFSAETINFPFKVLQHLSISLFGLSIFSIKLPAILISLATFFGIINLANTWFSRGVATLGSILAITSSHFFFLAQNGTPDILYIFYPIFLLFFGAKFLASKKRKRSFYALAFLAIAAFSLYTPVSLYILLALIITISIHPRLRLAIKRISKKKLAAGITFFIILIFPLLIGIFQNPPIIRILLGFPEQLNFFDNLKNLANNLFNFGVSSTFGVISPLINFSSVILIGVGFFFTFAERYSSRSYLINAWVIILLFVCALNPHFTTILFTPILLLTISGLRSLLQSWYTLFPLNPYARVAGLLPIVIFVGGLLITNLDNFRSNYAYSPEILASFNSDLKLLSNKTDKSSYKCLAVSENNVDFYRIWSNSEFQVNEFCDFVGYNIVISHDQIGKHTIPKNYKLTQIITSSKSQNADRFYIYALK